MDQEITVAPVTAGWTLKCTEADHEIYFRSGADAEERRTFSAPGWPGRVRRSRFRSSCAMAPWPGATFT